MPGNFPCFPYAQDTSVNQEQILEYHPTGVLHPAPWTGGWHPKNRLCPIAAAQKMIDGNDRRRRYQHLPISVECQERQRAEDVEVRFDTAASEVNQESRH